MVNKDFVAGLQMTIYGQSEMIKGLKEIIKKTRKDTIRGVLEKIEWNLGVVIDGKHIENRKDLEDIKKLINKSYD